MPDANLELARYALNSARQAGARCISVKTEEWAFAAVISEEGMEEPSLEAGEVNEAPIVEVKSNTVGYFKLSDEVRSKGATVEQGAKIGEIVALGIVNDLVAPVGGLVTEILVEDGAAVEFGQVLMKVKQ